MINQSGRRFDPNAIIYTVEANCHECYRCVRVCPVKAISVINGQARVENELCIKCGTCVRECPQHAKAIRNNLDDVKLLMQLQRPVAASVAPSFAAAFGGWRSSRLPAALRRLGFSYVSETAEGAALITEQSFADSTPGSLCSACPAVMSYIEKYRPEYVDSIIPIASPMIAHGRMLKKRLGPEWAVVFIGPCAAKKEESLRPANKGIIDVVLTFAELVQWLEEENIDFANCLESDFESFGNLDKARLFALPGGMLKTGGLDGEGFNKRVVSVSGPTDVMSLLDLPPREWSFDVAECLFCHSGCINGMGMPAAAVHKNPFSKKADVLAYTESAPASYKEIDRSVEAIGEFDAVQIPGLNTSISESDIQKVLDETGKGTPDQQNNCGACGYKTCRDNAIAVIRGLAEPGMCMPYMRRLAQQRTNRIIDTSPNAVVVLDESLNIIQINPAFMKMFHCDHSALGRRISYFMDADSFERLASGACEEYEAIKIKYGMRYHEQIYALREEKQYVGTFTDISRVTFDDRQIDLIQRQTLDQAKELLNHQIRFSQEMAHFLGRSTAQSEDLVKRMVDLYQQESERKQD